jgi:hypothetical protein
MTPQQRATARRSPDEDHATVGASCGSEATKGLLKGSSAQRDSIPCPSSPYEKPKSPDMSDRLRDSYTSGGDQPLARGKAGGICLHGHLGAIG